MLQWLRWWNKKAVPPSQSTRTIILLPPANSDSPEQPEPAVVAVHPPVAEPAPVSPIAVEPEPVLVEPKPIHITAQKEAVAAEIVEPAPLPEPTPPVPPADWRGPAYFLPGAYTLRWGIQPVLQSSRARSLPPAKYPASAPAPPSRQTATPPSAAIPGAFPFLIANDSASGMRVDPALFTEFLITREEELRPAAARYWTGSAILYPSRTLTEKLLHIESPLTPARLLTETAQPDPALALVVCHNVARAFARGSAILERKRTAPSFYRYFDPNSLGAVDPGAWYRFFAIAAVAAFASRGSIERLPGTPSLAALQIDSLAQQFPASTDDRRYAALAWANAVQFWEWGIYSRSAQAARASARQSLDAFRFGLRAVSADPSGPWRWSVPKPASLNSDDARFDASASLLEIQEAA